MPDPDDFMTPANQAYFKELQGALQRCEPGPEVKAELTKLRTPVSRKDINRFLRTLDPLDEKTVKELGRDPFSRSIKKILKNDRPQWNSVALFFNLSSTSSRPGDYADTAVADVRNWMDEGDSPSNPTIRDFVYRYWKTLSYGHLRFSMQVPRDGAGSPLIPTLAPPGGDAHKIVELAQLAIQANPEAVWAAGGSIVKDGKRYIPSVVLVHRYWDHPWAWFSWGWELTAGGATYLIGDFTHVNYDLTQQTLPTGHKTRGFWGGVLCHEFSHNFLEAYDLYGPGGCTGYWDILGDHLEPGKMSEACAIFKERVGWLSFKESISGPTVAPRTLELRPYTTTGDAYKIIPDPVHNPYEYFVLEYRKSTGTEPWRPDGGLPEQGLLITHVNERLGFGPKPWLLREAPFYDPEYADFSDFGEALWQGVGHLDYQRALFPYGTSNAFTPSTRPNSDFYGGRKSGLSITNIRLEAGVCRLELAINGTPRVGWTVSDRDRGLAGRFSQPSSAIGQEIFFRNEDSVALLTHVGGQVFVKSRQDDWIDGWNLGTDNREIVGDFDGDGSDEVLIRSPKWAGVLKYYGDRFRCDAIQNGWIGGWNLGSDNWELAADLDGDGKDEIYIRSPGWVGVIRYRRGAFSLASIQEREVGGWVLGARDREVVGRFTQSVRDEILILGRDELGLFEWNAAESKLKLRSLQKDWIDGWNIGTDNTVHVGDFDGDGLSEIYIRSPKWAGVLKWQGTGFRVLWMVNETIPHVHDDASLKLTLEGTDKSYAGRFFTNKDGIVHRAGGQLALLIWENNRMNVRFQLADWYTGGWRLSAGDKFILGDFHKVGVEGHAQMRDSRDVVPWDHVTNNLTDIFLHNGWGTGMTCFNYVATNFSKPGWDGTEWTLTWINPGKILVK
jgi:hypothetical protein